MCYSAINLNLSKPVYMYMLSGSNFKNTLAALIILRVDTSKFQRLTSSSLVYVSKANKSKGTCISMNESYIKSCRVLNFRIEWHERSKGRSYCSSELVLIIFWEFAVYSPYFFFVRRVVEMIDLLGTVVSLGETMYQSAFWALNFV